MISPRKSAAAFVWRMEEVLDLYKEPYTTPYVPLIRPVICFDERPCQLIGDLRDPLPMKPGHTSNASIRSTSEEGCAGF